jgi:hypothetical protein
MGIQFSGTNHNRPHERFPELPARVELDEDDPRHFHLNVGNVAALWPLLGLPFEDGQPSPIGEIPVPEARRALMRARARFERVAPRLVRPTVIEHGAPRLQEDGTVELRPLRAISFGLDEDGLAARLDRFERFVEAVVEGGATHIAWS